MIKTRPSILGIVSEGEPSDLLMFFSYLSDYPTMLVSFSFCAVFLACVARKAQVPTPTEQKIIPIEEKRN